MTPAERKKAKNIARKMQKKKAKAAASAANGESGKKDDKNGGKKKTKPHVIDEDPEGKELLALDHLEEAKKYASLLVRHAPKRMSAWALQYDISVRRGKMLLVLQVSRRDASLKLDWISIGTSSDWAWTLIVSILEPQALIEFPSLLGKRNSMVCDALRAAHPRGVTIVYEDDEHGRIGAGGGGQGRPRAASPPWIG